jgi:hypothetical protein
MGVDWITKFDRFMCATWQFGDIHQCKIFVQYEPTKCGEKLDLQYGSEYVGICREGYKTREKAMEKGVEWCAKYQKKGPGSVEAAYKYSVNYHQHKAGGL